MNKYRVSFDIPMEDFPGEADEVSELLRNHIQHDVPFKTSNVNVRVIREQPVEDEWRYYVNYKNLHDEIVWGTIDHTKKTADEVVAELNRTPGIAYAWRSPVESEEAQLLKAEHGVNNYDGPVLP